MLTGRVVDRLQALFIEKARRLQTILPIVQIVPDRAHLSVETNPTVLPARLAGLLKLKEFTSRVLQSAFQQLRDHLPVLRSRSCYIGPVGHVSEQLVRRDIAAQRGR